VAGPLPLPSLDLDEGEIVPDSELEFEDLENAVQNEASGDSSDDFVPEESSQGDLSDDGVPLSTTIPNTFARLSSSKAGPSSKSLKGRRSTVKAQSEADLSDWSDTEDSFVTSEKVSRRNKAAPKMGKGRKSAPQPRQRRRRRRGRHPESDESDQESDNSDNLLEPSDEDTKPPPRGLHPHQTQSLIKAAERKMRKKLGRKLTLVLPSIAYQNRLTLTIVPLFFPERKVNSTTPPLSPRTKELLGRSQEIRCHRHSEAGGTAQEPTGHSLTLPAGKLILDEKTGMWPLARRNPGSECAPHLLICALTYL
jgi:hypothetical protein